MITYKYNQETGKYEFFKAVPKHNPSRQLVERARQARELIEKSVKEREKATAEREAEFEKQYSEFIEKIKNEQSDTPVEHTEESIMTVIEEPVVKKTSKKKVVVEETAEE